MELRDRDKTDVGRICSGCGHKIYLDNLGDIECKCGDEKELNDETMKELTGETDDEYNNRINENENKGNHEFKSDKKKKSDEYYTKEYAIIPLLDYLEQGKTIWCPFDTEKSNYVKIFKRFGFKVISGHIDEGRDFFEYEPEEYDYIISNPPYSLRQDILTKLFSLNKPFAMLINISGLFDSKIRFNLFQNNPFEMMIFNKRIDYIKPLQKIKSSPPFASIYICSNILPSKIVFKEINRDDALNVEGAVE